MKEIISPISKDLLIAELSKDKFICHSNKGNTQIFSVTAKDSPNVMLEIGRLREIAYRSISSGTGEAYDIDYLDTADKPYSQLIVWDNNNAEILGGYRYILCRNANTDKNGVPQIGTARFFNFSQNFKDNFLPYAIELGRSFIRPELQATNNLRQGLFALDNLWDGLGALVNLNTEIKYFLGQVSVFKNLNRKARDMVLYFLKVYFPNHDKLITAKNEMLIKTPNDELKKIFIGKNMKDNYIILSKKVRLLNENIPPLINSYINTSPSMRTFGAIDNPHFYNMEDIGIMITIADIYENKKKRHIYPFAYLKNK